MSETIDWSITMASLFDLWKWYVFFLSDRILIFLLFLARSDGPVVVWFGHEPSTLKMKLIRYLVGQDVVLILFSTEDYLRQWLDSNRSLTIASLILQPSINSQQLIAHAHSHVNIRSILVRSTTAELINLVRFSRAYPKVDGIYDDDERLLSKLMIDLIFLSEELGDHFREDEHNEIAAQKNYDRVLNLCALAKTI